MPCPFGFGRMPPGVPGYLRHAVFAGRRRKLARASGYLVRPGTLAALVQIEPAGRNVQHQPQLGRGTLLRRVWRLWCVPSVRTSRTGGQNGYCKGDFLGAPHGGQRSKARAFKRRISKEMQTLASPAKPGMHACVPGPPRAARAGYRSRCERSRPCQNDRPAQSARFGRRAGAQPGRRS